MRQTLELEKHEMRQLIEGGELEIALPGGQSVKLKAEEPKRRYLRRNDDGAAAIDGAVLGNGKLDPRGICPICKHNAHSPGGLSSHLKHKHGRKKATPRFLPGKVKCDVAGCKRGFLNERGLGMHKWRAHGIR